MLKITIASPGVAGTPTALTVDLHPEVETARVVSGVAMIVDFDRFDDLVGMEILGFMKAAGSHALDQVTATATESEAYISYDGEVDAFYLRVSIPTGVRRPLSTRPMPGALELDESGCLLRLRAQAGG
jgi:hypothetical protein